jgi:hypothetical protein
MFRVAYITPGVAITLEKGLNVIPHWFINDTMATFLFRSLRALEYPVKSDGWNLGHTVQLAGEYLYRIGTFRLD